MDEAGRLARAQAEEPKEFGGRWRGCHRQDVNRITGREAVVVLVAVLVVVPAATIRHGSGASVEGLARVEVGRLAVGEVEKGCARRGS